MAIDKIIFLIIQNSIPRYYNISNIFLFKVNDSRNDCQVMIPRNVSKYKHFFKYNLYLFK